MFQLPVASGYDCGISNIISGFRSDNPEKSKANVTVTCDSYSVLLYQWSAWYTRNISM